MGNISSCADARSIDAQRSKAGASSRKLMIALYTSAVFLYWMALYLYVPTLPTYVESKSDNLALVGVVLSMYGLWQAVIRLPLGIVADWVGRRKPFILGGFALAGLGAYIMGAANEVNGLLIGRAITGLAAGTWVPLVTLFSGLYPPEQAVKASSLLTLIGSVGRVLATGVTGSLNEIGGYPLAFFLAAAAAGLAILIVLPSKENARPPQRPSVETLTLLTRRDVLVPSLLSSVAQYANWATTFGFIPILAKQLGATDITLSILLSLNIGVYTLGNLLATGIADRIDARNLVYLGFGLLTVGIAGAAIAPSLALVFVMQFIMGLGQGISYPVLMGLSIRHVEDAQRTTAMGLHQSVYAIGMFSGPALSGVIADALGIRPMLGVTAAACLILGAMGAQWLRDNRHRG
ncbi:MAG: MFS transporter [Chloroflexi bacterium]|nr:MFS transporter [Chloroflexota bacterium]